MITDKENLLPDNDILTTQYTQVPALDRDKGWKNDYLFTKR
jgi:hypothetical protein